MRLQILVTQYEETEEIIKPLLTSIGEQLGVDLAEDVEVLIGNDGSDVKLSDEFLKSFGYPIRYLHFGHSGLPGTRAKLHEASSGEYLMFCDADDRFISALGLHMVFVYMSKGFDAFASKFFREQKTADGKTFFTAEEHDGTFVHGKVYRRQYLADQRIIWHPELMYHEDFVFNTLAQQLTSNFVYCSFPFYLWKWRGDSLCRKDPLHHIKTYPMKIDATERLLYDFLERGRVPDAVHVANIGVLYCYFSMNMPEWSDPRNAEYRKRTEERMKAFYEKHQRLIESVDPVQRAAAVRLARTDMEKTGTLLVNMTFKDWLDSILKN